MKKVKGIPVWLIVVILIAVALGAVAAYILSSVNISVKVEEPLSVVWYPESLSLYPNTTEPFNITVNNIAPVNYLVSLTLSLNDTAYQQVYVTFSNTTYGVIPCLNNLTAWISVAADAPPASLALAVGLSRISEVQPTFGYTFTWTNETQALINGTLALRLNFTYLQDKMLIIAQINDTYAENSTQLGMVFDKDFNGFNMTDSGYIFTSDNESWSGFGVVIMQWGELVFGPKLPPVPSPYHNATYDARNGWTYRVMIPRTELPQKEGPYDHRGLKTHICFTGKSWRPTIWGYSVVFIEFLYEPWGVNE